MSNLINLIRLVAVVKGDPGKFSITEDKIREKLADAGMDIERASKALCYDAPKYSRWELDESSIKIVREIGMKMLEEMKRKLG